MVSPRGGKGATNPGVGGCSGNRDPRVLGQGAGGGGKSQAASHLTPNTRVEVGHLARGPQLICMWQMRTRYLGLKMMINW